MFDTRVTRMLGIRYPVIGGVMAQVTTPEFVAAISNAGGMGVLPSISHQSHDQFVEALRQVRRFTDKPFAVNLNFFPARFPVPQHEYAEIMAREGVMIVETSGHGAPPEELCAFFKEKGMIWIHKCAGLRYALKAQELGADIVTVVGYENGGATGRFDIGTMVLVPTVSSALEVPMIGGGGVVNGKGLASLLALGAEAVIMGTRFLLTQECPVHGNLKQALLNATEVDTMLIMRTVGTHRVWKNGAAVKCAEIEESGASFEEILQVVSGDNTLKVYKEGELDSGIVPCGQGIGQIHDLPTVRELFDNIIDEAREAIRRMEPN
ncbi:MAG: nitronate monooxygenase family protein [Dehalococcoidia bacterium]